MKIVSRDMQAMTLFALASFLFFISLTPVGATISLVIAMITWIAGKYYRNSFAAFRNNKIWWMFIAFYLFHILSLLWTTNFKYAFFDLQVKLGYFLCPLLMAGFVFSKAGWKTLRKAFILGSGLAAVICLFHALWQYVVYGKTEYFFYGKFSILMHPSYFMIYLNVSMLFILHQLLWTREENRKWRVGYIILLFIQLLTLFLLSGRTALAVTMFTLLIFVVVLARKKLLVKNDYGLISLFFGLAVVFQFGLLSLNNRYDQISNLIKEPGTKEENSTAVRYNLWKIAADLISEHPVIGVGIGDIKEELVRKYEEYQYEYGIKHRISPHNQYLHTGVILGVTGIFFLLAMLIAAFVLAWRNGDWLYMLFILIISLNAMTESILERQAGILFFAFLNALFASQYISIKSKEA